MTLTLNLAQQSSRMTLLLLMMHHRTKFGYKMFCSSEDIVHTKSGRMDRWTHENMNTVILTIYNPGAPAPPSHLGGGGGIMTTQASFWRITTTSLLLIKDHVLALHSHHQDGVYAIRIPTPSRPLFNATFTKTAFQLVTCFLGCLWLTTIPANQRGHHYTQGKQMFIRNS